MSHVTAQASLARNHTPIASKDFFTISKTNFELCKQNIPTKMFIILIICECGILLASLFKMHCKVLRHVEYEILLLSLVFVDAETDGGKGLITKIQ